MTGCMSCRRSIRKDREEGSVILKSFRGLIAWQKAMTLSRNIYKISQGFPRDELYGLTSQLRRCSVSVPANIAEGYGRYLPKDNIRFLRIANGSLYELQTLVELAQDFGYIKRDDFKTIENDSEEMIRILSGYIKKLSEKTR